MIFDSPPKQSPTATISWWTADSVSTSLKKTIEHLSWNPGVEHLAVMPDIHEGAAVPNGIVVAVRGLIYPRMVGSDIGCGVAALKFDCGAAEIPREDWPAILILIRRLIPTFKQHPHTVGANLPIICPAEKLSHPSLAQDAQREGRYQLGTLGRGNHFVEFQKDQDGCLWVMVHSGSRAMGQILTEFHLARSRQEHPSGQAFLDLSEPAGRAYFQDTEWAIDYARENRLHMLNRVADLLETRYRIAAIDTSYLDSPHNFARREWHLDQSLIVHRKSANGAFEGELGLIPGSMGTESRIVRGLGNPLALCSSAHGAGRQMSRTKAREAVSAKDLERSMKGIVLDTSLLSNLRDESPRAYKDLGKVMEAQKDLVRTVNVLKPICVYKGT